MSSMDMVLLTAYGRQQKAEFIGGVNGHQYPLQNADTQHDGAENQAGDNAEQAYAATAINTLIAINPRKNIFVCRGFERVMTRYRGR